MAEIYRLSPCDPLLPEIIVSSENLTLEVNLGDVICIVNGPQGNACYTVSKSLLPPTTTSTIYVNQIFEDCVSCTELCTTPINNVLLIPCIAGLGNIIVPYSNYNYPITPTTSVICLQTDDYASLCYTVQYTQLPINSQQVIVPKAFFGNCNTCQETCFYEFYTLVDCQTGEQYLNSTGQPLNFYYSGVTSTKVTAQGGIDFLTEVVLTNIYGPTGIEIAKGCLKLVEADYVDGLTYLPIDLTIDKVHSVDTCVQCKLRDCGDCDTLYTEKVNCKYAEQVYAVLLSKKYGLL